ncbi:DUF4167 domain-containing protein [Parasulfitobacter algicola]|uniref:DUF4167 domain-containing protein n=1 Tax=Parasulfitobacter algicola TaxID=2614809 RepID=A0ABX2IRD5_9RHOB|nr:DUF4167 domain-containing protein [Sulfitobacter algicola]NSX55444.1 DUF4167 domain-containing protein [Sulfitobacter algicola]
MRSSNKSRSRSKPNRNNNRPSGNVVNRVFDSSGPEGKVRGTPQQIIDKYNQLARDSQLSNDRVAAENFQQHSEHYTRLLGEAQREMDARREQQERENRERQAERDRERTDRQDHRENDPAQAPQPDLTADAIPAPASEESGLVETPESAPEKPKRPRRPRKPKLDETTKAPAAETPEAPEAAE